MTDDATNDKTITTRTVIPAAPGFKCIQPLSSRDGCPVSLDATDIVAWLVEYITDQSGNLISQFATPITPDIVFGDRPHAVQTPDGDYIFQCDCTIGKSKEAKNYVLEHFIEFWRIEKEIKERKK
jgi:hypothetical protein